MNRPEWTSVAPNGDVYCTLTNSGGVALPGNAANPVATQSDGHIIRWHDTDQHIIDVREASKVDDLMASTRPEIVFHMAAQPLVLRGYDEPVETWNVNVMGTIHVLEALRKLESPCTAVMVTTDKVYENREWEFGYRESDTLGGHDPYSSSKAAAEIAVSSWRRSFLNTKSNVKVATARAGNVIGGGDWSDNRIIPDIARSLGSGVPIEVRNSHATRPWQHVLDPLSGYLRLAQMVTEEASIICNDD